MRFQDYFKPKDTKKVISFEIFPPKTHKGMQNLRSELIPELVDLAPDYITVTYGAMGTTRDNTVEIAALIKKDYRMESACHLTCVGSTKQMLDEMLKRIYDAGISNIVAIRGDPPGGRDSFTPEAEGYSYGNELVEHIRGFENRLNISNHFGIAVAGYPEGHIDAPDLDTDVTNLKRKVESGANIVITQLFFDNTYYFEFVDRVRKAGIDVPILPGLMPILSTRQIERITSMCGSTIPKELKTKLHGALDDDNKAREIGIAQCITQAKELLEQGAPGIHFYVLNKCDHMKRILNELSSYINNS